MINLYEFMHRCANTIPIDSHHLEPLNIAREWIQISGLRWKSVDSHLTLQEENF